MMSAIEIEGARARVAVRQRWPRATSMYTGAISAAVIDDETDEILGKATSTEWSVEHAWIAAARRADREDAAHVKTPTIPGAQR